MKKLIEILQRVYRFLFLEHDVGFFRFAILILIPCALSHWVCRIWILVNCGLVTLVMYATQHGWNRFDFWEGDEHEAD